MKRILAISLTLVMLLVALTSCNASQTDNNSKSLCGTDLFSLENIKTVVFELGVGDQYSFHGSSVQKIVDYFSDFYFAIDPEPDNTDVDGTGWNMKIEYEGNHTETLFIAGNRTHIYTGNIKYKRISNSPIDIEALIDSLKDVYDTAGSRLPMVMTIAETLPSCVAFEYKDGNPYCFYAYDTEGHLYRVFWNDFTGLNEKDVITVQHTEEIKKLDYANPPGGWSPKYEVTAIEVSGVSTSCVSKNEDGAYILTLPNSGETIELRNEQRLFVPYITDALVEAAENKITQEIAEHSNNSGFYLQITEDYLCLTVEVIKELDPPESDSDGCGLAHEHLFFSERISSQAVKDKD